MKVGKGHGGAGYCLVLVGREEFICVWSSKLREATEACSLDNLVYLSSVGLERGTP